MTGSSTPTDVVTGYIGHFTDGTRCPVGIDSYCEPNIMPPHVAEAHPEWTRFPLSDKEKALLGIGGKTVCDDSYGVIFDMAHRYRDSPITHRAIVRSTPYDILLLGKHEIRVQQIILMPGDNSGIEGAVFCDQKLIVILDHIHRIIARMMYPPLNIILTNS